MHAYIGKPELSEQKQIKYTRIFELCGVRSFPVQDGNVFFFK